MAFSKGRLWLTPDSCETHIDAAPEQVYALVSDLPRMGQWSPECQRVEWIHGSTAATVGARFVGHNRGGPRRLMRWSRRGRVLVADPGREFAFATEEGGREGTVWRYRFEPVDGGTRVTESYEVEWIPVWARILDVPTNRCRELQEAMAHARAAQGHRRTHVTAARVAMSPDVEPGDTGDTHDLPGRARRQAETRPASSWPPRCPGGLR